jgi:predicted PurR-regulated permease PerM
VIVVTIVIVFIVSTTIAAGFVFAPQISDWIDEFTWSVVNRREYRRITIANPHLRPETLEQMTRRAWEEHQRRVA